MDSNETYVKVLGLWHNASEYSLVSGMGWYFEMSDWLRTVAAEYNESFDVVCAMFSALSPACSVNQNKKSLINVLERGENGIVGTYPQNKAKALRLRTDRDVYSEMYSPRAPKTWNFFMNLLAPQSADFVTLDRHMARIFGVDKRLIGNASTYRAYADIVKDCAEQAWFGGRLVLPHQFQAVLWLEVQPDQYWESN